MVRQFLPDMISSNKGHIVAISSLSAMCAIQGASVYSATKHAVLGAESRMIFPSFVRVPHYWSGVSFASPLGMMEALYYDLQTIAGNQVKTTCICPYFFRNNVIHEKNVELKLVFRVVIPVPEKRRANEIFWHFFRFRVKAMSAGHVARLSVDAILKNKTVYVIPPAMYFFVLWLR